MLNTRESRVLQAIQVLGTPTTMDVAMRCQMSTSETRKHLKQLADEGRIVADGRRWTVPSSRLYTVSARDLPGQVETTEPGSGCCAVFFVGGLVVFICGLAFIVSAIKGAL